MKQYEVISPVLSFAIKDGENEKKEHLLKKGDTVELPESNIAVKAMLARRQIRPVKTAKQPKETKK